MRPLPLTLNEAVDDLLLTLTEEDKAFVRSTPSSDLIQFHSNWGRAIRNSFHLWEKSSPLLADCKVEHPDEASMLIIHAVHKRLTT